MITFHEGGSFIEYMFKKVANQLCRQNLWKKTSETVVLITFQV